MNKKAYLLAAVLTLGTPAISMPVFAQSSAQTQAGTVSGTVIDELGDPVVGATVRVKGSKTEATATDIDGHFTIRAKKDAVIEVSYIGYRPLAVSVDGKNNLELHLIPSATALDEVVVTGYTTQKKESLTGAIAQIKGDEVYRGRGTTNTATALQGEIPGLTVTRTSSRPGSEGAAMEIRGAYSINGGGPLILIDGQAASLDELNSMDGNDIANISVLKDASAAIYGARSAGGVILVTTKRGRLGKPQVTYSGSYSRTIDGLQIPLTNNQEWLQMFFEGQYNDTMANNPDVTDHDEIMKRFNWWIFANNDNSGTPAQKNPETGAWEIIPGAETLTGQTLFNALMEGRTMTLMNAGGVVARWEPNNYLNDYLFGNANTWKHNLSIAGGDEQFNYRASLNYSDAQSQLRIAEDGEKKYGARLNADYKPNDIFKIETGMSYERRNIKTPSQGVGQGYMDPWFWAFTTPEGLPYDTFSKERNPVGFIKDGGQIETRWNTFRANGKITLDFSKWVKGLSIAGSGAYKRVEREETKSQTEVRFYDWAGNNVTKGNVKSSPARLDEYHRYWNSFTLGAFAYYNRKFGLHDVNAMIGITGEQEDYKNISAGRYKGEVYPGSGLVDLEVWNGGDNNAAGGGQNSWSFMSYVADLRYAYADRYLISFLGRRDGSSKLTPNNRWKNFYSISGGWVISNEKFWENIGANNYVNFLKIRYNYGKTGSVNGIGNYESFSTIKTGSVYLGGVSQTTMWIDGMRSANRTWETLLSHDAGIDFGFFNNRLRASFDWFQKTNKGMFIDVVYPDVLGAKAPKTNNGKLRTRGWELEFNWRDRVGQVNYNFGFNLFDAKTKVLELTNNDNIPNVGTNSKRLIGKPIDCIYVYQTDGVFQTQEEVDAYYEMYYWNADHSGPKPGNILPAPAQNGTSRLRPGARKRVDVNGNGVIDKDDIYYAGDKSPRLSFGIKGGADWKGIDISFFFQGIGKQTILRSGYLYAPLVANYTQQNNTFVGKGWTPENHSNKYTIFSRDNNFNKFNYENSDVSVTTNRYIRLKNLVVGYTLPRQWTSKVGVDKFRVYFSGDDLWEWTKVKDGYDPEHGEASNNIFPFSRMLNFGVELTF